MFELFLSDYRALAQDVLALALIAVALVWGGGPERAVALGWLIVFEIAPLVGAAVWDNQPSLAEMSVLFATLDVIALAVWGTCAIYANRNYTLWIAAMQMLSVVAHLAKGLVETISPIAYAAMAISPGWLILMFFAIGLARHLLRRRQYGAYRDWRRTDQRPSVEFASGQKWSVKAILGYDAIASRGER
ncbi:MAG: hypothetical protein AAGL10_08595 [Pseudomonadota bacterium]